MSNEEIKKTADYGKDRNTLVLVTLSGIILGLLVPLIVWAINKDKMQLEAKTYLTNLLNFELTLLVTGVGVILTNIIPVLGQIIYILGGTLICIINLIVLIIAVVKVSGNSEYKFPLTYQFLK